MNILIVGYYGFGLVSDDAVLQSLVDDVLGIDVDVRIAATTAGRRPLSVEGVAEEVRIASLSDVLAAISRADLVLVGGGGVYNEDNVYRNGSFMTPRQGFNELCAAVPIVCGSIGKPCAIIGVGVFSLKSEVLRRRVREAFRAASAASVRDRKSFDNLMECEGEEIAAEVTADPVFRLKSEPTTSESIRSIKADGLLLGVSLRHWNVDNNCVSVLPNAWEREVAAAIDEFLDHHDGRCVFFPFQNVPESGGFSDDVPVMRRVVALMRDPSRADILPMISSPRRMAWSIHQADVMLCMRYHSVIMAIGQARPVVAIAYSEKIMNTLKECGLERAAIDLPDLNRSRLLHLLESEFVGSESRRLCRTNLARRMAQVSHRNVQLVQSLISSPTVKRVNAPLLGQLFFEALCRASRLEEKMSAGDASIDMRIAFLEIVVTDNPRDSEARYRLGSLLTERCRTPTAQPGDAELAERHLRMALAEGANEYWCRYFLAVVKYHLSDFDEALCELQQAALLMPDRDDCAKLERIVLNAMKTT